jgi:hypothetical protein
LEFLHVPIPNERHSLQKSRTFCAVFFLWSYIYSYIYIVIYSYIYIHMFNIILILI